MKSQCLEKNCTHSVEKNSQYCYKHAKECIKCHVHFSKLIHGDLCPDCKKEKLKYEKHVRLCNHCNKMEYFSLKSQAVCDKCKNEIKNIIEFNKHHMECPACHNISYFTKSGIQIENTLNFKPVKLQEYCDECIIAGAADKNNSIIINNITNKFVFAFYNLKNCILFKDRFYLEYISSDINLDKLKYAKNRDSKINNNKYFKFISSLSSNLALSLYNLENWNNTYIEDIVKCFINSVSDIDGYCLPDCSNFENQKFILINISDKLYNWYKEIPKNIIDIVLEVIFTFKCSTIEGCGEFLLKMFSINICKTNKSAGDIHYKNGKLAEVKSMISEGGAGRFIHNRDNHFSVRSVADKYFVIQQIIKTSFYKHLNKTKKIEIDNKLESADLQDFIFYKNNEKREDGIYKFLYNICKDYYKDDLFELINLFLRKFCYKNYNGNLLLTNLDLSIEENLHSFMLINSIYIFLNEIENDQLILATKNKFIIFNKSLLYSYSIFDCKQLLQLVEPVFPTTELTLTGNTNDRNKNRGFAIMQKK